MGEIRNLINITDFSVEEIDELIRVADYIVENHAAYEDICAHKNWRLFSLNRAPEPDSALKLLCWNWAEASLVSPPQTPALPQRAKA